MAAGGGKTEALTRRLRVHVRGAVQGVGFRPYVHRLAAELHLRGWVRNGPQGVDIEVEGPAASVESFRLRLPVEKPPHAVLQGLESTILDPLGYAGFEIRASATGGPRRTFVLPDIATCAACLEEILDPGERRYRYPFTNCTHCGPRATIIESLPYDRARTSMNGFPLCGDCRAEYEDPSDRRFHAQPIACPACGPRLELWADEATRIAAGEEALAGACDAIRAGQIVALKGVGGFQLLVDARNEGAVRRLRERKHREEKPLAIMAPSLAILGMIARAGPLEERLLDSPEAPIVLLEAQDGHGLAPSLAPGNPYLGVMLPYSPLHHLLMRDLGFPIVATSGNLSDEPLCTMNAEAFRRLQGIADRFLVHDRPIVRPVDDSVARVVLGRVTLLRRARGYAPLPLAIPDGEEVLLALGGQLKSTVALALGGEAFLSPHIGDLDHALADEQFRRTIADMKRLYDVEPRGVVCDAHPDYRSTRHAASLGLPVTAVQHHHAHMAAAMTENDLEGPALGVCWDGTGYGADGTIWGGEFLLAGRTGAFRRVAHLRPFRLPGGEAAARDPRRTAYGLLFEILGPAVEERTDLPPVASLTPTERRTLSRMLERGLNAPVTTSAGRLFDSVASLAGIAQETRFEAQPAMALEFAAGLPAAGGFGDPPYPLPLRAPQAPDLLWVLDWEPLLREILDDRARGSSPRTLSRRFHAGLAAGILEVARRMAEPRIVLSGGCFQNRLLMEETVRRLEGSGFAVSWHQRVPPNDGGLAFGQLAAVRRAAAARKAPAVDSGGAAYVPRDPR
jgi:hydrogenase maturation protein HypF